MKKIFIFLTSLFVLCFVIYISFFSHSQASDASLEFEHYYNEDEAYNKNKENNDSKNNDIHSNPILDTNPESILVFVNKEYSLPADYVPEDLVIPNVFFNFSYYDEKKLMRKEAATALEELFSAAKKENIILCGISGYRSYARQKTIYSKNIIKKGVSYTNKYSAMPGKSEHQTGLSIDVSAASIGYRLEPIFSETKEGIWLANNCYQYGFIIRYPKDKSDITGYAYEPWHIRYVGIDVATYLYKNNLTFEEYVKYTPSIDLNEDISYDSVVDEDSLSPDYEETSSPKPSISVTPSISPTPSNTVTPSISPTPSVTLKPSISPTPEATKKPTNKPVKSDSPTPTAVPTHDNHQKDEDDLDNSENTDDTKPTITPSQIPDDNVDEPLKPVDTISPKPTELKP